MRIAKNVPAFLRGKAGMFFIANAACEYGARNPREAGKPQPGYK